MALPGPAPDPNKVGRTPNADWTEVPDVPFTGGPKLPRGAWHSQTKAWWEIVRAMPHAALWTPADWMFASDTAVLKEKFYSGEAGSGEMTEMRRREDLMALSSEARRKARIRYIAPPAVDDTATTGGNVTSISGRSSRRIVED